MTELFIHEGDTLKRPFNSDDYAAMRAGGNQSAKLTFVHMPIGIPVKARYVRTSKQKARLDSYNPLKVLLGPNGRSIKDDRAKEAYRFVRDNIENWLPKEIYDIGGIYGKKVHSVEVRFVTTFACTAKRKSEFPDDVMAAKSPMHMKVNVDRIPKNVETLVRGLSKKPILYAYDVESYDKHEEPMHDYWDGHNAFDLGNLMLDHNIATLGTVRAYIDCPVHLMSVLALQDIEQRNSLTAEGKYHIIDSSKVGTCGMWHHGTYIRVSDSYVTRMMAVKDYTHGR